MKQGQVVSWRIAMSQIEAIFRHGVFEPLAPVDLKEEQRVRLSIEPAEKEAVEAWLERVRARHEEILRRRGGEPLPDSTPEIAEDRMR
jgi:predicted DNA-binding antitoxin AbrB/MazE fold protein